jgi:hypothetical protein
VCDPQHADRNSQKEPIMKTSRSIWIAAAASALVLATASARASDVSWSVGIQAPVGPGVSVGTMISNRSYGPVAPVIYPPAPVVYAAPTPVYVPPPVYVPAPVYTPAPVLLPAPVYTPRRVVYGAPVWVTGRWIYPAHHHHHHEPEWREPQYLPRHPGREIRY